MRNKFAFENLEVWQLSRSYLKLIYSLTKTFPEFERFILANQLERAALSVMTNLAEGSGRKSGKEQARFTEIAYSSLLETASLSIASFDKNYISEEDLNQIRSKVKNLSV